MTARGPAEARSAPAGAESRPPDSIVRSARALTYLSQARGKSKASKSLKKSPSKAVQKSLKNPFQTPENLAPICIIMAAARRLSLVGFELDAQLGRSGSVARAPLESASGRVKLGPSAQRTGKPLDLEWTETNE